MEAHVTVYVATVEEVRQPVKDSNQAQGDDRSIRPLISPHITMAVDEDPPLNMSRQLKIVHTLLIFGAFLGFGLCRGVYGPTLLELRTIAGVTQERISLLFPCLGFGGVLGCLVFGRLFDLYNPLCLVSGALSALALLTFLIPWFNVLAVMMAICGGHAFFFTGIAIGCNVTILRLWRHQARPIFLSMHLLYTVGSFIAPLLSKPFLNAEILHGNMTGFDLVERTNSNLSRGSQCYPGTVRGELEKNYTTHGYRAGSVLPTLSHPPTVSSDTMSDRRTEELYIPSNDSFPTNHTRYHQTSKSRIHFTYAIITAYLSIVTAAFILLLLKMRSKKTGRYWRSRTMTAAFVLHIPFLYRLVVVVLFMGSTVSFGGVETVYSGLLFTFAFEHVGFSHLRGSLLVSTLFTSFAVGRFIMIFISHCVSNAFYMLVFDVIGAMTAALTLAYFKTTSAVALWVCTVLTGVSVSTMYTMGLLWAKDFLPVTATFTSLYTIAFTMGMMLWPTLTSSLMTIRGPAWFTYMIVLMLLCYIIFLVLLYCLKRLPVRFKNTGVKSVEKHDRNLAASIHSIHSV